jgi:hypothetical protein
MERNDEIQVELTQISNLLTTCIEKIVQLRYKLLDTVTCGICQKREADSICQCGLNLCTNCEITHRHTSISH